MLNTTPVTVIRETSTGFLDGIKNTVVISLGVALFSFAFGVLAHTKGLSLLASTIMSAVLFAGAAQMISLQTWSIGHQEVMMIIAICFVVCLRFTLMGMSLQPHFKGVPKTRVYLSLLFLVDENWGLTILKARQENKSNNYLNAYFFGSGLLLYLVWVGSSFLGNLLGQFILHPEKLGFNFVFLAIFLVLTIGVWRGKSDLIPWLASGLVSILSYHYLHNDWYIILGALTGSTVGVICASKR